MNHSTIILRPHNIAKLLDCSEDDVLKSIETRTPVKNVNLPQPLAQDDSGYQFSYDQVMIALAQAFPANR